jgi:hypothetical protein
MQIIAFGPIEKAPIQPGWMPIESESDPDIISRHQSYCSPDCSELEISLYYRGRPISEKSAQNFLHILGQKPHELSSEEVSSVREALGNLGYESLFLMSCCETIAVAGRIVLKVEGIWCENRRRFTGILVNTDQEGREITAFYMSGPTDVFEKHIQTFDIALAGISWR